MNLEDVVLGEMSPRQQDKPGRVHLQEVPRGARRIETENRRAWGKGKNGIYFLMSTEPQFGVMKKFWKCTVVAAEQCKQTNPTELHT